ncbi:MFS family permease [Acetoanaerobium pronyense]|uniref:MFS family permease n=1 Tax=Acetoanaerobium pronyense TaxID=1482736 RepID=A0ABS4KFY6_9FIRM|nr:OFA family MFS transporter [Acetoanaerobium pronyense]MBP2026682.1 MFS family permease [Acetoanaerobium pronyense]
MEISSLKREGYKVLLAGLFINLTIGVLYSWSVISKALIADYGWSSSEASLPYSVAIMVWGTTLLIAGRLQDKIGPRKVVTLGVILTGAGLIISGLVQSTSMITASFGILVGSGIGFAYATVTPPALKWFHPSKKGMVTGIVVSGMGLASLYIAPSTTKLLQVFGISKTFLILGTFILAVAVPLAQLIKNPPQGYIPEEPVQKSTKEKKISPAMESRDFNWREMMHTKQFYMFWIMFAFASSAGLMIIGNIATIAKTQASVENGFFLVGLLAIFNASGRLIGGSLSDKIGRLKTMMIFFAIQAINMLVFSTYTSTLGISIGTAIAGLSYGSLLCLFPSVIADYYGVKNFGANYGVLFTAWGVSGVIGPIIAGTVVDVTGSFTLSYTISSVLLGIALVMAFFIKPLASEETISSFNSKQAFKVAKNKI